MLTSELLFTTRKGEPGSSLNHHHETHDYESRNPKIQTIRAPAAVLAAKPKTKKNSAVNFSLEKNLQVFC